VEGVNPIVLGHTIDVTVATDIVVLVLLVIPVIVLGALFVWGARKDGEEDRELQRRLGIKRKTRLGR
jgi:hypothetical protein